MVLRYIILVRNDFRESHITLFYLFSYFLTTLMTLTVYWYTSKAFAGAVESQIQQFNLRYFDFIVIGELTFLLPTIFYNGPLENIKKWLNNNTFESLLMTGRSPYKELWNQVCAGIPSQSLFALMYVSIAVFVFGWRASFVGILGATTMIAFCLPMFFFIGLIMTSFFLLTGRGSSLMSQFVGFIAILSGAYFPIHVLPTWFTDVSYLNPFQTLMDSSRFALADQASKIPVGQFFVQVGIGTLFLGVMAYLMFHFALKTIQKRGSYFPKTRSVL